EDDQDATVAFWPPGTDHDVDASGRGAPVDRADIVPDHVLAERVELAALAAEQRAVLPVQLPQPCELLRQMPAAGERGQHPDRPGGLVAALARGEPQRAERPDRHPGR